MVWQLPTGWDGLGDLVIGGDKYRRIKREDATVTSSSYRWEKGTDYRYFKYQPIKWRVLSVDGSETFLLADKALDDKQYHTAYENVTWEGSTIRSWLNGYGASANLQKEDYSSSNFINTAFSESARAAIRDTRIENKYNLNDGTGGGEDTVDKVLLLSVTVYVMKHAGRNQASMQKLWGYGLTVRSVTQGIAAGGCVRRAMVVVVRQV